MNEKAILAGLQDYPVDLFLFSEIDSTNQYLKNRATPARFRVCCAEKQTAGRGRFGRQWQSPFGENIYLSVAFIWTDTLSKLSGLSLAMSLAITQSLSPISQHIKIKWPNDLLWQDKKLCGILIELNGLSTLGTEVVIGIGINVNSQSVDNPWCSLKEIKGISFDRNPLIANLLLTLFNYLALFKAHSLNYFLSDWKTHDYLYGKRLAVYQGNTIIRGQAQGVNQQGHLLIQTEGEDKAIIEISSGEASISGFN